MESKDIILELLQKLSISYRWVDHPAVFTVEESSLHIKDKKPIKNLLLQEKNKGELILVVMAGDQRLDTKLLASKLGTKKLQFADSETLLATLGVTPGAVSVFGLLNESSKEVRVAIDANLIKESELGFHPNVNTATIFIAGSALIPIIKHLGHHFEILELY